MTGIAEGLGCLLLAEPEDLESGFPQAHGQPGEVAVARDEAEAVEALGVQGSIASMISALSVAFLPVVYANCWTGLIAWRCSTFFQEALVGDVKSP